MLGQSRSAYLDSESHERSVSTPCTPTRGRSPSPPRSSSLNRRPSLRSPSPAAKVARLGNKITTRRAFKPEDFLTPDWTTEQVEAWLEAYPALKKRNFFILQRHEPSLHPPHFDLRIQLDNKLITFRIPSPDGIDHVPLKGQSDDFDWGRLAVEDKTREINIALLDGGGLGVIQTVDVGEYRILPRTKEVRSRQRAKDAMRRQGFSDETTTDESDVSDHQEDEAPDERQETLFAEDFYHASFMALPSRWGRSGRSAEHDSGDRRGFVLELRGARHQGLRLQFQRWSELYQRVPFFNIDEKPQGGIFSFFQHLWYFNLDSRPGSRGTITPSNGRSLITNRTMDEIRADKETSPTSAEEWHAWNEQLASKWEKGKRGRRPWNCRKREDDKSKDGDDDEERRKFHARLSTRAGSRRPPRGRKSVVE